jgi:Golgi phosphoprotein 3 (GPP34)
MTPLLALHAATATLPVRWEATLLGGGWRGSADDDLLPAAGLLLDAGFEGAVALEGARRFGRDRRHIVPGRSGAGARLVDDLAARVGRATPEAPYGWCERAAVFAPDAVSEELVELGLVEYRETGWLRKALRYKAFELLDTGARDVAIARVRDAVADPDGAPDTAVALALLLRATGVLSRVAGAPPSRRIERALEERRQELPPVAAAILEALDARRRRLDAVGT